LNSSDSGQEPFEGYCEHLKLTKLRKKWDYAEKRSGSDYGSSGSIIRIKKARRMRWAGHVARMREKKNA
jgi:hypothetical protein